MSDLLRVLLLEDNPADAELNQHALRKAGLAFEARRVEQREDFIAALAEFQPDLVLADYHLPRFDGLQALAIVREYQPHLPFIFVSGAMGEDTAVASLRQGASDYVLKDRLARLPEAVKRALDEARAGRRLEATQRALEASEARFRALVETTSDWIWEVDAAVRYTYSSPAVLPLLGYTPEEVVGRTPFDLMPPAEAEWVGHRFAELAAAREAISQLENVCLHRDGHRVILETTAVPIFTAAGEYAGYRGIDRDITARKQADVALRESELKFRLLSEHAVDCIFWTAPDGRYLYVSPACETLTGHAEEDLRADPELMASLIHPDDQATYRAHMENLREFDQENLECRLVQRGGAVRWISHHCRAIYGEDGQYLGRRGSNTDITSRKRSEMALLESEARLNEVQQYARLGSWELDKDQKTAVWAKETYAILGLPADVTTGPGTLRQLVDPVDWAGLEASLRHSFATGEEHHAEYRIRRADHGDPRWIECRGKAILDDHGRPEKLRGFIQDISERKAAEAAIALNARRAEALLELPRVAESLDEAAFMQHGQELAEQLTGSCIAFIHFVNDDQETIELVAWSRRTLESYCRAAYDRHYPVSQAGLWADALRRRAPVVVNDYPAAPKQRGLPEGHAELIRLISVPVLEGGKVRMLAGVGNKADDYSDIDVETVQLIANEIWRIVRQRRADHSLRDSEARLRSILRATPVGIGEVVDRVFTEVNETMLRLTGYRRDELIGQSSRLVYLSDAEYERVGREKYAQIREHGIGAVETQFRRKDGEIRDIHLSSALTDPDDPGKGVTFSAQDITERKRVENSLRKLAQAVEQSPESIAITDLHARLEYVNEAFLQNTGYRREEAIGQNPRILNSGKTPKATYDALWDSLKNGRPWKGEFVNKRKDGSEYVEFAIITPLRQPDGRISHYVAVKEDITEKKRVAAELDQYRLHLEDQVEARTAELKAAREEAERLARVKSEFLANMSHEIRTPLNGVLGFAQIGLRDGEGGKSRDAFRHILDSGQSLLRVVNDILDFSKIEAGKLNIEQGRLRPGELVDHCAEQARVLARDKGLELVVEKAADLPASCLGDPLRLSQVLMNLLGNAVKFTQHGCVTLSARRDGESLRFRVSDTGIGLSEEELGHLFQPFEQADTSTTRKFGGTGLGLAISKRLLDLMGGGVEVSSRLGEGSVFEVSLPLLEAEGLASTREPETASSPPPPVGRRLQGLSILVAEDNEVNRMVLEELLSGEGCRLTQVENGQLALEQVQANGAGAFDLVLMDIQMPVMDGFEATRRIKAIAPRLPVIGLTAHALAEEREHCLAVGMVDHVAKPVVLSELIRAIRGHVAGLGDRMETPDAEPAAAPPAGLGNAVDWPALETRHHGNMGFLERLLNAILQGNGDTPDALRQAVETGDLKRLAFITHSLKGMAGDILPRPIRDLAAQTEADARMGRAIAFGNAGMLAAALSGFLADVAAYLERAAATRSTSGAASEPLDQAEVDARLAGLRDLLATSDTRANPLYMESADLLRRAYGDATRRLGREILAFDYEAALATLERLQAR